MIPITLEYLSESDFLPKKDYTSNRLSQGILQMTDGTVLVLDETGLQSGKLPAKGQAILCILTHDN